MKMGRERAARFLLAGALAFALLGQYYFAHRRDYFWDGVLLYAVAVTLFLSLVRREERPAGPGWLARLGQQLGWGRRSWALVGLAGLCAAVTVRLISSGPQSYWPAFGFWVAGMGLFMAAFVRWPGWRPLARRWGGWLVANRQEIAIVGGLTLVALALRAFDLGHIPWLLHDDEGAFGWEARRVLSGVQPNMFTVGYLDHPTLFFFIQALSLRLFGGTVAGLRAVSAIAGALTVPALYLFVRSLLGGEALRPALKHRAERAKSPAGTVVQPEELCSFSAMALASRSGLRRLALMAAALLAVSHYHVHYSRLALNNVWDPLWACLIFFLLNEGRRRSRAWLYALAGIALGLSLYFYASSRLTLLLVAILLGYDMLTTEQFWRKGAAHVTVLVTGALLAYLPFLLFLKGHAYAFLIAGQRISILGPGRWLATQQAATGRSAISLLAEQFTRTLLAFNYYPDRMVSRLYNPGVPLLDFVSGILFVFGLVYATSRLRERGYFLLSAWFWLIIVFCGTLVEKPPGSPRLILISPVLSVLAAVGLAGLLDVARRALSLKQPTVERVALVVLTLVAALNVHFYFWQYTPSRRFGTFRMEQTNAIGHYLAQTSPLPSGGSEGGKGPRRAYIVGPPHIFFKYNIGFVSDADGVDVTAPVTDPTTFVAGDRDAVFVFVPERLGELDVVRRFYPGGRLRTFTDEVSHDTLFVAYEVESEELR